MSPHRPPTASSLRRLLRVIGCAEVSDIESALVNPDGCGRFAVYRPGCPASVVLQTQSLQAAWDTLLTRAQGLFYTLAWHRSVAIGYLNCSANERHVVDDYVYDRSHDVFDCVHRWLYDLVPPAPPTLPSDWFDRYVRAYISRVQQRQTAEFHSTYWRYDLPIAVARERAERLMALTGAPAPGQRRSRL